MPENEKPATRLEKLYAYLKRFHRSESLFVIATVNSALKYGCKTINREDIPQPTLDWLDEHFKDERSRIELTMQLTRLARFILLAKTSDFNRRKVLDTGTIELKTAYDMHALLFDKDVEGEITSPSDVVRSMGRISQWQFPLQMNRQIIMGRGYLFFVEIPKALNLTYDFDLKMKEHFGIGIFEFMTSGLSIFIMTNGVMKHDLDVQIDALKSVVTKDSLRIFVTLSSGTVYDYIHHVRVNNWKEVNKLRDIYALEPFYLMPAIMVVNSLHLTNGTFVVPQPLFLLFRASLGPYYLLADKERDIAAVAGKDYKNDFKVSFGEVYNEYVRRQLSQAVEPLIFVDFDTKQYDDGIKKPDFAIIQGEICVLFEVKTLILSLSSRTLFNEDSVRSEIKAGSNFEKALIQLNTFIGALNNGRLVDDDFRSVKNFIKVIVSFEDVYLANALILPIATEIYGEEANDLQIASISDIDIIGGLLASGIPVPELTLGKLSTETNDWALGVYLAGKVKDRKGTNPVINKAYEDYMERFSGKTREEVKAALEE